MEGSSYSKTNVSLTNGQKEEKILGQNTAHTESNQLGEKIFSSMMETQVEPRSF